MTIEELISPSEVDLEQIAELITQLRGKDISVADIKTDVEAIVQSSVKAIIVAREVDEIVGVLVVNILMKLAKREARIDEFVVDSNVRGGGLGKKIITFALDWAWSKDCNTVELTSRPSRVAANHLYQKLGFALRKTNVYVLRNDLK